MKWYDDEKGYGFVEVGDGGRDVFVHANVLRAAGLAYLIDGQRISIGVRTSAKGREATSLQIL